MEVLVSLRKIVGLVGAVGVAWQLVVVVLAVRHAPVLERALRELGLDMPTSTRAFLASYRWWISIPALVTIWLVASIGRASASPRGAISAALAALALGLILQTWLNDAVLTPLRSILQAIG